MEAVIGMLTFFCDLQNNNLFMNDTMLLRLCDCKQWSKNYKKMSVSGKKDESRMTELLSIVLSVCGFSPGLPLIHGGG